MIRLTPQRSCLLGIVVAALCLAIARHLFGGVWCLRWDDGLWVTMARRWCAGARLYADVWESKGPLHFLWLRPMCSLSPPAPGLISAAMLAAFWVPLLGVYALGAVILAGELTTLGALVFGMALVPLAWDGRTGELFATEKLAAGFVFVALACLAGRRGRSLGVALALTAAALCNLRCAPLLPLYLFAPRRRIARDVGASLALVALVCLVTLGLDRDSYRWLLETFTYASSYPGLPLGRRLALVWENRLLGQPGAWEILLNPLQGWREDLFLHSRWIKALLVAPFVPSLARALRARPELVAALLLTAFAVYRTGIVFSHTFVLFVPPIAAFVAFHLARGGRAAAVPVALWCALALGVELARPETISYAGYARADQIAHWSRIRERLSRELANRRWVALVGNSFPILSLPGVSLPENRMFHAYCYALPDWAEAQVRTAVEGGGVRVVVQESFDRESCAPRAIVREVRDRCSLEGSLEVIGAGAFSFYDCDRKTSFSISTTRSS